VRNISLIRSMQPELVAYRTLLRCARNSLHTIYDVRVSAHTGKRRIGSGRLHRVVRRGSMRATDTFTPRPHHCR
jgi:hypothetical protein